MTEPRVLGLDLAAELSGVCLPDGTTCLIRAPKPAGKHRSLADDLARIDHVVRAMENILATHPVDLAVIEDYAHGLRSAAAHRLAEISGGIRLACHRAGVPIALVNVQHLKIYATGKGGAPKSDLVLAAYKRAGREFATEDECDAFWLHAMGLDHLGHPIAVMPDLNRAALAKTTWPTLTPASELALFGQPDREKP